MLKKSEFDYVFQQANKVVTNEFIFLYRNNSSGHARLGLALSKKMIAKAHDRNRLKRALRESFRTKHLPEVDVIVLARNGVGKLERKTIFTNLGKAWDKLATVCKK